MVSGRDTSLTCVVRNLDTYKVAWVHLQRQMILSIHDRVITNIDRYRVSHVGEDTWQLHISNVQVSDGGYYMCQVNTDPLISQIGYLQVYEPPEILDEASSHSTINAKWWDNVTLKCSARGVPQPEVVWRRQDNRPLNIPDTQLRQYSEHNKNRYHVERKGEMSVWRNESLSLLRVTNADMGTYLCIARNGVPPSVSKQIQVNVEFKPMIWIPHQLIAGAVGASVRLECKTEAFPPAIVYWVKNSTQNRFIVSSSRHQIIKRSSGYSTDVELRITRLQQSDFGTYMCVGKNYLGSVVGSIRLYERFGKKASTTRPTTPSTERVEEPGIYTFGGFEQTEKQTEFTYREPRRKTKQRNGEHTFQKKRIDKDRKSATGKHNASIIFLVVMSAVSKFSA